MKFGVSQSADVFIDVGHGTAKLRPSALQSGTGSNGSWSEVRL